MTRRDLIQFFGKPIVVRFETHWIVVLLIIFLIAQYCIAFKVKKYLEKKYKYISSDDPGSTNYMLYYKKNQIFDLIRLTLSVFAI